MSMKELVPMSEFRVSEAHPAEYPTEHFTISGNLTYTTINIVMMKAEGGVCGPKNPDVSLLHSG
jgi:hypothetical protein